MKSESEKDRKTKARKEEEYRRKTGGEGRRVKRLEEDLRAVAGREKKV